MSESRLKPFCARLKRLQMASGLSQAALAGQVGLGKSQMSSILNGGITRLPEWDLIRAMVTACLGHAAKTGRTVPADVGGYEGWRLRYNDLEHDTEISNSPHVGVGYLGNRPISQWDPFALGVHHPIAARNFGAGSANLPVLPRYVMRDHDWRLRQLLDPALLGPRMAVLVGESSTGKTRAAYEAVRDCLPTQPLLRPETSAELLRLLDRPLRGSPTVLWLNETQTYLDGDHGEEAAAALRRLLAGKASTIVLGSMWPAHWQALTSRPRGGMPDHPQARELLDQSATRISVPYRFTDQERKYVGQAATGDPRLAEALNASPRGEITQILAGGPWLVDFYEHGADAHTRAVLDAAMDACLVGHRAPLPAILMQSAATGYLDAHGRAAACDWFDRALAQATIKIKDAVAPLTAVRLRRGVGEPDGYMLADYLIQYASTERFRPLPPADLWDALDVHTVRPEDHVRIAESARFGHNYWRRAAMHLKPAAQHGDCRSMLGLASLFERAGRIDQADEWLSLAAESGDATAMRFLAYRREGSGDDEEAESLLRDAIEHGDALARRSLIQLLERAGRRAEAEQLLRSHACAGDKDAMCELGVHLQRMGRLSEAEGWLQRAMKHGNLLAKFQLARIPERAGRIEEAIGLWLPAAREGRPHAVQALCRLLERLGRDSEAERWRRRAAEGGDPVALHVLAYRFARDGRIQDAIAVWQPIADRGPGFAMRELGLLLEGTGQSDDAEGWLRQPAERGDARAMNALARIMERARRNNELEQWLRQRSELGDVKAMRTLAALLQRTGQSDDCEWWLRHAAENGDRDSITELATLLNDTDRRDEAVRLTKFGIEPGGHTADCWA